MVLRTILRLIPVLVLIPLGGTAEAAQAKPVWKIRVVEVSKLSSHDLLPLVPPVLRGRVVEPLVVEAQPDVSEQSYVVHVRLVNASRVVQTLRWDVDRSPHLALSNGKTILPIGHRLYGFSENSFAIKGVLEVDVPPEGLYDLHPIFFVGRMPVDTRLIIDRVGSVRVSR